MSSRPVLAPRREIQSTFGLIDRWTTVVKILAPTGLDRRHGVPP